MARLLYPIDVDFAGGSWAVVGKSAEGRREVKALMDSMACTDLRLDGNLISFEDLGCQVVKFAFKKPGGDEAAGFLTVDFSTGLEERVAQLITG